MFDLSVSSVYIHPLNSKGGIVDLKLGIIKVLRVAHQSLDESVSDLSLSAILLKNFYLESRIMVIASLHNVLHLFQYRSKLLRNPFLYALFRFLM